MIESQTMELLRLHAADLAICLFAVGAVLGSSAWIVGAGIVAGTHMAARLLGGRLMSVDRPAGLNAARHR